MSKLLKTLLGGGEKPLLEQAADIADRFIENPEEKKEFLKEAFQAEVKDRDTARELYAQDNGIQKVFSMVFLVGYLAITGVLLWWAFHPGMEEISDFQISLISSIFGAMSMKVNTICEFFFGGSLRSEKTIKDVTKHMKK